MASESEDRFLSGEDLAKEENTIRLWDPATGKEIRALSGQNGSIHSDFAVAPSMLCGISGRHLFSCPCWTPASP
jgi:hypothetical protein